MKKLLTILLVLGTLITCVLALSSCDIVTKWGMEKNPNQELSDALNKSLSNFFSDEAGLNKVLKKAEEKGKYTVSFESDDLMGGELTKVSETIYTDKKNNQMVSKTQIVYNGEKLSATLFGKDDKLALQSKSIFGDNTALLFNPKTFVKEFEDSGLVDYLALDNKTVDQILEAYEKIVEDSKLDDDQKKEKLDRINNDIYAMMDQTVDGEMVEGPDGRERYYIVTTYTLDNKSAKNILEYLFEIAIEEMEDIDDTAVEELEEDFNDFIDEFDDHLEIDVEYKAYVDTLEGTLYMITLEGEIVYIENDYDYTYNPDTFEMETEIVETTETTIEIECLFKITDTQILLDCDLLVSDDGTEQKIELDAEMNKEVEDGNVTYDLLVVVGTDSINIEIIDAVYEYEDNGDITITVKLPSELVGNGNSTNKIVIKGNAEVEKDSAKITIDSVKYDNVTYKFDLIFMVEAVDSIPEFPDDAEDIMDISKKEWEEINEKIQNSDLAKLFSSDYQPEPYPEP